MGSQSAIHKTRRGCSCSLWWVVDAAQVKLLQDGYLLRSSETAIPGSEMRSLRDTRIGKRREELVDHGQVFEVLIELESQLLGRGGLHRPHSDWRDLVP